jgi:hypothetical protein
MIIPIKHSALVTLAQRALAGATAIGTPVGLAQNTAPRLNVDYQALMGDPAATPANTGTQGEYNKTRGALTTAQKARVLALDNGHKLCANAIDALKAHLGRKWNPRWAAAGFGGFTIAVKETEVGAKLIELRNFFRDNPTREITSEGITATACEAANVAIVAAEHARNAAKNAFQAARDARDASFRQLKERLSGLQEELGRLLTDDDSRWAEFGFTRPIDGSIPDAVEGVTATPGLPSTVLVQWMASARAINYRVSWSLAVSGAEITEVGLFADRAVNLSGLPSGAMVTIYVTARNNSGETSATEVDVTVP